MKKKDQKYQKKYIFMMPFHLIFKRSYFETNETNNLFKIFDRFDQNFFSLQKFNQILNIYNVFQQILQFKRNN